MYGRFRDCAKPSRTAEIGRIPDRQAVSRAVQRLEHVGIRETAAVGVDAAQVCRYFGSKEPLFRDVIRHRTRHVSSRPIWEASGQGACSKLGSIGLLSAAAASSALASIGRCVAAISKIGST
jgi:hypothetical protein